MADDYDMDLDDLLDFDDGWLYVDDEYNLADELAEGQIATPGYCGTNYEIDSEAYEFDLFNYWEDLEYADDAYWDYGLAQQKEDGTGNKRKRGALKRPFADKRLKTQIYKVADRDAEPLLFRSRDERILSFFRPPPRLEGKDKFAFLPDWRERFAERDGQVVDTKMPAAMRRAAEGRNDDTSPRKQHIHVSTESEEEATGEDDWEDDDMEGEDSNELGIDPEMIKSILKERLGAAGLGDMDEEAFMNTIQQMMAGEGDDAASALADTLLGQVTSSTGNEAVSGWLSGQGVSLEKVEEDEEDDHIEVNGASRDLLSCAQEEFQPKTATPRGRKSQIPLHSGSPPSLKKRSVPHAGEPTKQRKRVKFDVPPSSLESHQPASEREQELLTSDDPLLSERTIHSAAEEKTATTKVSSNPETESQVGETGSGRKGRKRKAATFEETSDPKPVKKKTRNRELESLGAPTSLPSPAPPAKRTRSAKAKSGR